ncbi:MAG: UTP--glucose-1-phosphate uridylyltransferase [Acidimicrobiia bacterium]
MSAVRTAILPVAGLGTRFLPASKATPKVLLPILDRPLLQYAVDEVLAAGIESIVIVTGRGQGAIEDYFDMNFELEMKLSDHGRHEELASLRELRPDAGRVAYVRQIQPLGLGHAVWCARELIGNEPFAVLLPDELIVGDPPPLRTMVERHAELGGNIVLVDEVDPSDTHKYGIITPDETNNGATRVTSIVEKPRPEDAASNLAVVGRYILESEVMNLLGSLEAGAGNEIQLTDAIKASIASTPLHAVTVEGERYDCGSKEGFLAATVAKAMADPSLEDTMTNLARSIVDNGGGTHDKA